MPLRFTNDNPDGDKMSEQRNYITPEGLQRLKEEQYQLLHVDRPKVVETVAWAASNGDRSENADYIYGKRRLREIDARIRFLQERIEKAVVVKYEDIRTDVVVFGCWVSLVDKEGKTIQYQIVGEDEFDIKNKKISWKSPVAKGLLGKKVGDVVQIQVPNGWMELEIVEISK
jgi:transcription elongation factor GreB